MLELGDGCCLATVCAVYFLSVCALLARVGFDNHHTVHQNVAGIRCHLCAFVTLANISWSLGVSSERIRKLSFFFLS